MNLFSSVAPDATDPDNSYSFEFLQKRLLEYRKTEGFSGSVISLDRSVMNKLSEYMEKKQQSVYFPSLGQKFLQDFELITSSSKLKKAASRDIALLDSFVLGTEIPLSTRTAKFSVPENFQDAYDGFIESCQSKGIKKGTLYIRKNLASKFFANLDFCGCHSPAEITPEIVMKATLISPKTNSFLVDRQILRFLAKSGLCDKDYSPLVPTEKNIEHLPDVYTKEELTKLESSYDRQTIKGKRDYAMVMLGTRLKLRSSDIVGLQFKELDFVTDHIILHQKKTGVPIKLPLVPEVKDALRDYIDTARPKSTCAYVFLSTRAPYGHHITRGGYYRVVSEGFIRAGVKAEGRHRGSHVLRSSGASNMVNSGVSYEIVRKSIGQTDKNVIRHYAKLNVEQLRKCALDPPKVTEGSYFERFLRGDTSI